MVIFQFYNGHIRVGLLLAKPRWRRFGSFWSFGISLDFMWSRAPTSLTTLGGVFNHLTELLIAKAIMMTFKGHQTTLTYSSAYAKFGFQTMFKHFYLQETMSVH